jgi:ribosome biogenesis GTPase
MAISNTTQEGIEALKMHLQKGKTYCLLGSSGVGKSSLINSLTRTQKMKTNTISASTNKGRHVTSHRELVVLESGGILIDNPGIREVGIADAPGGLETTFETITAMAESCMFKDCTHTTETGCAVIMAADTGEIEKSAYENFLKMEREKMHFESTLAEKRKKDKDFGKMVRNIKKIKNLKNIE